MDNKIEFRHAIDKDLEKIVSFQEKHHDGGEYVRDIYSGISPEMDYSNYFLLLDIETKNIISCTMLIPEYIYLDGTRLNCGRFELTATDERYRNKGMMRRLFKLTEEWYKSNGGDITSVSGKPWFYSQYSGYALSRGVENLMISSMNIDHYANKPTRYHITQCDENEYHTISKMYKNYVSRQKIINVHQNDEALMKYDSYPKGVRLIRDVSDNIVGGFIYSPEPNDGCYEVQRLCLEKKVTLIDVRNAIFTYFIKESQSITDFVLQGIMFNLGNNHPFYNIIRTKNLFDNIHGKPLLTARNGDFSGYYKILDIETIMKKLIPVFENRISNSPMSNFTGEFKLGIYRKLDTFHFIFDNGEIKQLKLIKQEYGNSNMPIEMLTQLIFGYMKVDDLYPKFFTEIFIQDEDDLFILKALFESI